MGIFLRRIFLVVFLSGALVSQAAETGQVHVIPFSDSEWPKYQNHQEGYSLRLPPELTKSFEKRNDPEWAAANIMPFDYVNFKPEQAAGIEYAPFELGVGVHSNRTGLSARKFADIKDEGVKMSVRKYVTARSTEVIVAGIKGVRDDFSMLKDSGWWSYSRVIIPFKDKFFVFLGTLGRDKPAAEYERVFQRIIDSFEISN
jgi:hypothetical protein